MPVRRPATRHISHTSLFAMVCVELTCGGVLAQFPGPLVTIADAEKNSVHGDGRHLKGVVTCVDDHQFFLQDDTGAILVSLQSAADKVRAGDELEFMGQMVRFPYGFQVNTSIVVKTGTRPLPPPEEVSLGALLAGAARHQLVRTRASVHDVGMVGSQVRVLLYADSAPGQSVGTTWTEMWWKVPPSESLKRPDHLLDAVVEITAAAARGSGNRGQATLSRLVLNSPADLKIIKDGNADIYLRPFHTLASLRMKPAPYCERLRVRGVVSYYSESGWFYIKDDSGIARAARPALLQMPDSQRRITQKNPSLKPGDQIELVGFPYSREYKDSFLPWLLQCEWRITGHVQPPEFRPLEAAAVLHGSYDGHSISLIGRVADTRLDRDNAGYFNYFLTLEDEGSSFVAHLRQRNQVHLPVKINDYAHVSGVVMANQDSLGTTKSFQLNVSDISDIRATTRPMRPARLLPWLLGISGLGLAVGVWIVLLRRQVRQQTARLVAANDELARFKQVADSSTDFIAMATLENRPLYMNPSGRGMLGIGAGQDLNEITFSDICPPATMNLLQNVGFPHAFQHGHWQAELSMRKLNGEEVPVSFLGLVLKDPAGRPQYISSIARDISDRHALEQRLLESNKDLQRFKVIADTMKDLVAMADLDKNALYINAAGRALLGIGLDEDAASLKFESIYTEESLAMFEREGYAHAFQHGHWNAEITMRHRDGTIIPVAFCGLVLRNPDGSPLCMSCIAHDLTQRLALEKQLRASLDHERELNQLKSGFVNTISHEFRTPLGIILFASSMLRRFNEKFSADDRAAQLDAIDDAVNRMNELVEQSLSLGRAEVAAPQKTTFDLQKFSKRIIDEIMSATSHRSPVSLASESPLPLVHTDETMLRTILTNLLGNAVKYSPAGSPISLRIENVDGVKARLIVSDLGPGLNKDDLPKLFTTFHRGKGVEGIPGTGLGLAIVKRCAEALGGTVIARNSPGGGAEFVVELPVFVSPS
ncbi:MAG: ATP-binding protein [Verrucomicrobiaceae bacterium]